MKWDIGCNKGEAQVLGRGDDNYDFREKWWIFLLKEQFTTLLPKGYWSDCIGPLLDVDQHYFTFFLTSA